MRALLLKDFYNLKASFKTMLLVLAVFLAFLILRRYEYLLALVPVLLSASLVTTAVSLDTRCRFNLLMLTTPVKKEEQVREKFFLLLMVNLAGILMGTLFSLPFLANGRVKVVSWLDMILLGWTVSLLAGTVFLTAVYQMRRELAERMEILMLLSYLVSMGGVLALYTFLPRLAGVFRENKLLFHTGVFLVILGLWEGMKRVSMKRYRTKEAV